MTFQRENMQLFLYKPAKPRSAILYIFKDIPQQKNSATILCFYILWHYRPQSYKKLDVILILREWTSLKQNYWQVKQRISVTDLWLQKYIVYSYLVLV